MKRTFLVLASTLALGLGALPAAAQPPELAPLHRAGGEAVEDSYIVVMEPGRSAEPAAERAGVKPTHVYEHVLDGFAATLDDRQLEAVRRNPNVAYVEEDQVARATTAGAGARDVVAASRSPENRPDRRRGGDEVTVAATQTNAPWNLDRIDQRYLPLDGRYTYNTTAPDADVYVLDTGIDPNHPEFRGKVLAGYDAFGGNSWDCNGHGTAMAGVAAGKTYGVAKDAWLWSVRVLNCNGSGTYSGIIAGTDWVRTNAAQWPGYPAVANYSLGGGYSSALNAAVDNLSNSGVFVAVASGGSSGDACNYSPASAPTVFTSNASDRNDQAASFSNGGPCTHGYAPGVSVTTAWLGGGTITLSGSVSAPHVAGVGALYKSTYGSVPSSTVKSWIINNATRGVIKGVPPNTPNRLLYKSSL